MLCVLHNFDTHMRQRFVIECAHNVKQYIYFGHISKTTISQASPLQWRPVTKNNIQRDASSKKSAHDKPGVNL